VRFPARIVHPPPLANASGTQLNVQGLKLKLRVNRKCGPREVPPNSGHWIHLDCNLHLALTKAKAFSPRKIRILLAGKLKLDAPVGEAGQAGSLDKATVGALPQAVDHRNDGTEGPIEDQGQVGACTAFSLASAMDNGIRRQNKPDTMSPLHIWSHYGLPVIRNAGDDNINRPIAAWDTWPYDERVACEIDQSGDGDCGPYLPPVIPGSAKVDPGVEAKIKDSDAKGRWRVTEYDEITADPDTIGAMLATGADVWFTMNIGSTWMNPQGDTIGDWNEGQVEGGHAVLFAGYRHKNGQRQFLVHNSWGKDWADQGFGYVSEAMVRQFIKHAYKVVVADASSAPPPSDPSALTDDDCGEDQLVDSVTGQCATICPDDSRPADGQCDMAGAKRPPGAAPPPASTPPRGMKLQPKH
jgi:Papain family cysteine protease